MAPPVGVLWRILREQLVVKMRAHADENKINAIGLIVLFIFPSRAGLFHTTKQL